jgi:hypothetical protein
LKSADGPPGTKPFIEQKSNSNFDLRKIVMFICPEAVRSALDAYRISQPPRRGSSLRQYVCFSGICPGLIAELVAANHILYDQGVVDAFGHVSARHDKRPDRFLLARNMAPGSVEADDIIASTRSPHKCVVQLRLALWIRRELRF